MWSVTGLFFCKGLSGHCGDGSKGAVRGQPQPGLRLLVGVRFQMDSEQRAPGLASRLDLGRGEGENSKEMLVFALSNWVRGC